MDLPEVLVSVPNELKNVVMLLKGDHWRGITGIIAFYHAGRFSMPANIADNIVVSMHWRRVRRRSFTDGFYSMGAAPVFPLKAVPEIMHRCRGDIQPARLGVRH